MEDKDIKEADEEPTAARADSPRWKHTGCHCGRARPVLFILLVLAIVFVSFAAGRFSSRGGSFGHAGYQLGKPGMNGGGRFDRGEMGGREDVGALVDGKVTAISGNTMTVNSDSKDYTVNIVETTSISRNRSIAKQSDIAVGNTVSVKGKSKSDGSVDATSISIKTS
jgi:hypothetical protein